MRNALPSNSVVSFNELKADSFVKKQGLTGTQDHHRVNCSRVYPHPNRVASGNFDPMPMWAAGFQFVALNYQSEDMANILNEGLFQHENGGVGYILKPAEVAGLSASGKRSRAAQDSLRKFGGTVTSGSVAADSISIDCTGTPSEKEATIRSPVHEPPLELEVIVLSAHCLPRSRSPLVSERGVVDPVVRISLHGTFEERVSVETRRILDNGFNPRWGQSFVLKVRQPSTAIITFEVYHYERSVWTSALQGGTFEERLAAVAFPVIGLRQGIRWAHLRDWRHHSIEHCGLLLHLNLPEPLVQLQKSQLVSSLMSASQKSRTCLESSNETGSTKSIDLAGGVSKLALVAGEDIVPDGVRDIMSKRLPDGVQAEGLEAEAQPITRVSFEEVSAELTRCRPLACCWTSKEDSISFVEAPRALLRSERVLTGSRTSSFV